MNKSLETELTAIFGADANVRSNDKSTIVNLSQEVEMGQVVELVNLCNEYEEEFTIKRSGAGLKIELKQLTKA